MGALVLALHGSRHPGARAVADALADAVGVRLPGVSVLTGWVDVLDPHVADVLGGLADAVVVPVFMTAGYHVDADLPQAVKRRLRRSDEGATSRSRCVLTPHVGPHLLDAVASRLLEAGGPGDAVVLAAAGSLREGSLAEVARAADALAARWGVPVRPGYLYAAAPPVEDAMAGLRAEGFTDVSVVPYTIAPGLFEDRLRRLGAARVAAPVGVHPVLVDAVVAAWQEVSRTAAAR